MKLSTILESYRSLTGEYRSPPGASYGAFEIPGPCGMHLVIIASDGSGVGGELGDWEHVSVSCKKRCPNWIEMCHVKNLFWAPEECIVQYHPPASAHVNNHPYVLHMWKWTRGEFPMPPSILIGVKEVGEIKTAEQARIVQQIAKQATQNEEWRNPR
jgi:hypothetical protein